MTSFTKRGEYKISSILEAVGDQGEELAIIHLDPANPNGDPPRTMRIPRRYAEHFVVGRYYHWAETLEEWGQQPEGVE